MNEYLLLYQDQEGNLYPYTKQDNTLGNVLLVEREDRKEYLIPTAVLKRNCSPLALWNDVSASLVFSTYKDISYKTDNMFHVLLITNDLIYARVNQDTLDRILEAGWQEMLLNGYGQCLIKEIEDGL